LTPPQFLGKLRHCIRLALTITSSRISRQVAQMRVQSPHWLVI